MIISPKLGANMLKELYKSEKTQPFALWFQPGAENEEIEAFIKEHNLENRVVIGGPCVLLHGDEAREKADAKL